jgi:hypothetical protein
MKFAVISAKRAMRIWDSVTVRIGPSLWVAISNPFFPTAHSIYLESGRTASIDKDGTTVRNAIMIGSSLWLTETPPSCDVPSPCHTG